MHALRAFTLATACACVVQIALASPAVAAPGWSPPGPFVLPGAPARVAVQIGYQTGGTATVAFVEAPSLSPLRTVLHVGVIAPGGSYQEQLQIASGENSLPADVKLAEAPDGAAVLEWTVIKGSEPTTAPLEYLASYRPAGSGSWETPVTVAADATQKSGIGDTLVPAISSDGTAAAGVEHLDPTIPSPGGQRIDVAIRPASGEWGAPTQISPTSDSSEGLELGFDSNGDLTAAFRLELSNTRHTLAAKRRPASSGVWGSLEDITGSDVTSDAGGPALGVGDDGSAVIAFQYVHYAGSKTLDVNAVTRSGANGPWTSATDVVPGGASSAPEAAGVAPNREAYVLYTYQGQSSGEDCVGVIRDSTGGGPLSPPQCVSPTNFQSGYSGGVAFLGDDAYFAWSGTPNGASGPLVEGSRWLASSPQPDVFTDLDVPAKGVQLEQLTADQDGGVAAIWNTESGLQAAAFDAGGPNLLGASVPSTAVAGQSVAMSATFADLWSGLAGPPSWSFGDGSLTSGGTVSHTYATPGTYTVTVTSQDGLGNPTSSSYQVTVSAAPAGNSSAPAPIAHLKLLAAKVTGQRVAVTLECTGSACAGEASLKTREQLHGNTPFAVQARAGRGRHSSRTLIVGRSRLSLAAGRRMIVYVSLNRAGNALLARFHKLPVALVIDMKVKLAEKRLTIRLAKARKAHAEH